MAHANRLVKRHEAAAAARLQALDAREPALITLPIPIPSNIPLISPLVDTLFAGIPFPTLSLPNIFSFPTTTSTTKTSLPASPTTAAASTPTSSPDTSNNNGGGNSSDNGEGNTDGSTTGNSGSQPETSSSADGASSPTATAPASGEEPSQPSSPALPSGNSPSGSALGTGSLLPTATVLTGSSVLDSITLPGGQTVPVPTQKAVANAAGTPSSGTTIGAVFTGSSSTITFSAAGSQSTGSSGTGDSNGSGDGTGSGGTDSGSGASSDSSAHHRLSTAVIAVIGVVGGLLLLALLVLLCRRRAVARRLARRHHWFGRDDASRSVYGAVNSSDYFRQNPPSARSSFGTSFEHEADPFSMAAPPLPSMSPSPDLPFHNGNNITTSSSGTPQMTQNSSHTFVALPTAAATTHSSPSPTLRTSDRTSVGSFETATSDLPGRPDSAQSGQVLLVPARTAGTDPFAHDLPTPLSVRPFSPTERWSFPKPPTSVARSVASSLQRASDPFADVSIHVSAPDDPFADYNSLDGHTAETFVTAASSAGETVRRPFVPTKDDEMGVEPGERVEVVRRYDDGWAYGENRARGVRGLFPVECLSD